MAEEMKKYLKQLLAKVDNLLCILITDRDGVPILKAVHEKCPEPAMRPNFLTTFAMATDQSSKLGQGRNKTIICMYSSYQVIQMNKLPLILNFIGTADCNTGHILSLEPLIEPLLDELRGAVIESL